MSHSKTYEVLRQTFDAPSSAVYARELETVETTIHEVKTPELKGLELFPVDTNFDEATTEITSRQYEAIGEAVIVGASGQDPPRVDVLFTETTARVVKIGDSYAYTIDELLATRRTGRSLDQLRARAAKKAIDQKLDRIIQYGEKAGNVLGVLNQPNVLTYSLPADGTGSAKTWASKDALKVIRDMNAAVAYMLAQTKDIEKPNTLVVPPSLFAYVAGTPWSTGSDMTISKFFMANNSYITQVASWSVLEAAALDAIETAGYDLTRTTGETRMLMYKRDPDVIKINMPVMFSADAAQLHGWVYSVRCHARTGGAVSQLPKGLMYIDGA